MSATLIIIAGVSLLLILALAITLGPAPDEPEAEPAPPLNDRVEALIARVNGGDDEPEAVRRLMSMGHGVLTPIAERLARLEDNPQALSPHAQLVLEAILIDYGLLTWIHTAPTLTLTHRASLVFPATLRVLSGLGPHLLPEIARTPPPSAILVPVLWRLALDVDGLASLGELLSSADPLAAPALDALALDALPALVSTPGSLDELLAACDDVGRRRLVDALSPWIGAHDAFDGLREGDFGPALLEAAALRRCAAAPAQERPRILQDALSMALSAPWRGEGGALERGLLIAAPAACALAALQSAPPDAAERHAQALRLVEDLKPDPCEESAAARRLRVERALQWVEDPTSRRAGIMALGDLTDDPRSVERLVRIAADPADPCGASALVVLARCGQGPVEALLSARARSAALTDEERIHLRLAVALNPEAFGELLARLLRAESLRVASLAAQLAAPLSLTLTQILKALGRPRRAAIEEAVAPLLWARWAEVADALPEALSSDDREVCRAAIWIAAVLGDPACAEPLVLLIERDHDLLEPALNALEIIGPASIAPLSRFSRRHPEQARALAIGRRLKILEALAPPADPPPATSLGSIRRLPTFKPLRRE